MVPYVAYLRVYEPLCAFDETEVARWSPYTSSTDGSNTLTMLRAEQLDALTATLGAPATAPPVGEEGVYVLRDGDDVFACPVDLRLRSWLAMASLIEELGDNQLRLLTPGSIEHVSPEFLRWRAAHPDSVPHIRQSTWQVPPAWFLLVEDAEREVYQLDRTVETARDGPASVRYRLPMVRARRRCGRAFAAVRNAFDDDPVVATVRELGSWLEEFHPHSRVELDYAGVGRLLQQRCDTDPATDTSARDVARAVQALAAGDVATATQCYAEVVERWRLVRLAEHAN